MKFKIKFIFEIIKCVHAVILSQCVFDAIRVNMGLTPSMLRIDFYWYRPTARNMPSSEISSLREKFCELPGSLLDKLRALHSFLKNQLGSIGGLFKFRGDIRTD